MPGTPILYYGDEIGVEGVEFVCANTDSQAPLERASDGVDLAVDEEIDTREHADQRVVAPLPPESLILRSARTSWAIDAQRCHSRRQPWTASI